MSTLRTRGVWTSFVEALAAPALATADVTQVAEHVRAACARARMKAVYVVDGEDFEGQFGTDWRGASEMADSVNHALRCDRDAAADAVIALPPTGAGRAYLELVAETIDGLLANKGDYAAQTLAGLLSDITRAVASGLSEGEPS